MTHYQDIKIIPDTDINLGFLRNKIYQKLHKVLFDLQAVDIGVSFPALKEQKNKIPNIFLGDVLRLHSTKESLENLQKQNWLGGLNGYCQISGILSVPTEIQGYKNIARIRPKGSMGESDLRAKISHKQKKGDLKTNEEIRNYQKQYRKEMFLRQLDNPYIELTSNSSGQNRYKIYLHFNELQSEPIIGDFNRFGLSKTATIPVF